MSDHKLNSIIYSPRSSLASPVRFVSEMLSDFGKSWELALALAKRDLSAMYRQSILGYVWAFLPVLATTGVFLFLRSGGAFNLPDAKMAYPVYLLIGSLLWQVFTDAVNGPLKVVTTSRTMIVKINFPRESLIIAAMLITLVNFGIRVLILIPALIYFSMNGLYGFSLLGACLFPLGVLTIILLGYTFGVLLTPLGMLYKDVSMGVQMILGFWMFLSPVVMMIPKDDSLLRQVMMWNPITPMIDTTRSWLVGVPTEMLGYFGVVLGITLFLLVVGWTIYRVSLPHVIARLGM